MSTRRRLPALLALAALALACRRAPPPTAEKLTAELFAMGGIPIHLTAWEADRTAFDAAVEAYRLEIQRLEGAMSKHRTESVLSKLNRAQGAPLRVDADTAEVIREAVRFSRETGGAFDPTVGTLLDLWKAAERSGVPPTPEAVEAARARVGTDRIAFADETPEGTQVRLEPGTSLDLGGIAKGYFADLGLRLLRAHGFRRGLVELGGDLSAFDDRERPEPFRIGVRDPRNPQGLLGVLRFDGGSVVTSGDYERGYEIAGRSYNHIVDPRTGVPTTGTHSVTLLAETGARADALATGVLVLGPDEGLALVERLDGVEALIVADDPAAPGRTRTLISSGLRDRFEPAAP